MLVGVERELLFGVELTAADDRDRFVGGVVKELSVERLFFGVVVGIVFLQKDNFLRASTPSV